MLYAGLVIILIIVNDRVDLTTGQFLLGVLACVCIYWWGDNLKKEG